MGSRIAPLLAIVYLDSIERRSLTTGIIFYKRYIDDVFIIGSSPAELEGTLRNLNSQDPSIKFTVENPHNDGFVPFLNTKVRIRHGNTELSWYKKPASKNVLLHARSGHPLYMKANVVRNLVITKEKICTQRSSEVDSMVDRILKENGYSSSRTHTWKPHSTPDGIPLVLPYLNENTALKVNNIVKCSPLPIRLIFRPPPNLKRLLTFSRPYENGCGRTGCRYCNQSKICQLRGTVYLVECQGCGQKYVGETGRPLYKRIDEHRRAMGNPPSYPNSSFSRHRTHAHAHQEPPSLSITVLHRSVENAMERKILEALEIKRLSPEINNREELRDIMQVIM